MSKLKIIIKGEEKLVALNSKISDLILELNLDITKIAIERNLEIVNQDEFSDVTLAEGDQLEIVNFVGGG